MSPKYQFPLNWWIYFLKNGKKRRVEVCQCETNRTLIEFVVYVIFDIRKCRISINSIPFFTTVVENRDCIVIVKLDCNFLFVNSMVCGKHVNGLAQQIIFHEFKMFSELWRKIWVEVFTWIWLNTRKIKGVQSQTPFTYNCTQKNVFGFK